MATEDSLRRWVRSEVEAKNWEAFVVESSDVMGEVSELEEKEVTEPERWGGVVVVEVSMAAVALPVIWRDCGLCWGMVGIGGCLLSP